MKTGERLVLMRRGYDAVMLQQIMLSYRYGYRGSCSTGVMRHMNHSQQRPTCVRTRRRRLRFDKKNRQINGYHGFECWYHGWGNEETTEVARCSTARYGNLLIHLLRVWDNSSSSCRPAPNMIPSHGTKWCGIRDVCTPNAAVSVQRERDMEMGRACAHGAQEFRVNIPSGQIRLM